MDHLIPKLFFGAWIEKFRILTTIYLLFICVLMTNFFVNKMGYYYNHSDKTIEVSEIINFILSTKGAMVAILFTITFLTVFVFYKHILYLINLLVYILLGKALPIILIVFLLIISFQFKKIRLDIIYFNKDALDSIIKYGITTENGVKQKGKYFDLFKSIIQSFNEVNNHILENVSRIAVILITTIIVFLQYNLNHVLPSFLTIFLYIVTVYWTLNTTVIIALDKKKKYLEDILLDVKQ